MLSITYTIVEAPIKMSKETIWQNRFTNLVQIISSSRNKAKIMKDARDLKLRWKTRLEKSGKKIEVICGVTGD